MYTLWVLLHSNCSWWLKNPYSQRSAILVEAESKPPEQVRVSESWEARERERVSGAAREREQVLELAAVLALVQERVPKSEEAPVLARAGVRVSGAVREPVRERELGSGEAPERRLGLASRD